MARVVHVNELPLRGISTQETTGDGSITIVPSDSGVMFVNKYTTGTTTYTLPTPAAAKGKWFWFYQAQGSADLKITSGTVNLFIGGGSETADYMDTNAQNEGDAAIVVSDGTYFYLLPLTGTWDKGDA